ncbi:MAG: citrate/2-methylcitrate synthase [Candidatus Njordarchaeia archaeon]
MARKLKPEEQKWCVDPETGEPKINKGLEGVCIDFSKLSFIDGYHSKLYIMGYSIEDLAEKSTFEEVAYLLLYGKLPTKSELEEFDSKLRDNRELPDKLINLLKEMPPDTNPLEVLRTAVSYLGNLDPNKHDISREGYYEKAISLFAKMPTIVAYFYRLSNGKELVHPNKNLSHAANFLYMFHGEEKPELFNKAMDVSLILYTEHGMNASTFTSVVISSTMTDYYSTIVGAIGALRGILHGYANVKAMEQFMEIGSEDNVEKWFNEYIMTKKKRLMGFGHRVYRSYDPRARIFREYVKKLKDMAGEEVRKYYNIAIKLEDIALKSPLVQKGIFTNCDYWSCLMYLALGIPVNYYTALFAMSRVTGWTAHVLEYTENNRIIRPRIYYIGEIEKEYVPLEERG